MLIFNYASKADLKAAIGQSLSYAETSMFGPEYRATGKLVGSNRPSITKIGNPKTRKLAREFFAEVTMENHKIVAVS